MFEFREATGEPFNFSSCYQYEGFYRWLRRSIAVGTSSLTGQVFKNLAIERLSQNKHKCQKEMYLAPAKKVNRTKRDDR